MERPGPRSTDRQDNFPDVLSGDVILSFIRDRMRIDNPLKMGGLVVILVTLRVLVIPLVTGYLFPRPGIVSYLETWPNPLVHFIVIPTLVSLSMYQGTAVSEVFRRLRSRGVIVGSPKDFAGLYGCLARWYGHRRLWQVLMALVLLSYTCGAIQRHSSGPPVPSWAYPNNVVLGAVLQAAMWGFCFYVIIGMAMRHFISVYGLVQLFRRPFRLKLHIFHEDRVCGLGPLGDFLMLVAKFEAILGLGMLMSSVTGVVAEHQPAGYPVVPLVTYMLFAPTAFIVPLVWAWRGMRRAKRDLQAAIAKRATHIFSPSDLGQGLSDAPVRDLEHMATLGDIAQVLRSLPTLPINLGQLRRLVSYYLAPPAAWLVPRMAAVVTMIRSLLAL